MARAHSHVELYKITTRYNWPSPLLVTHRYYTSCIIENRVYIVGHGQNQRTAYEDDNDIHKPISLVWWHTPTAINPAIRNKSSCISAGCYGQSL